MHDIVNLKIKLMSKGMKTSLAARQELVRQSKNQLTIEDYATTSGIIIILPDDVYVNVPVNDLFCRSADILLDFADGEFQLKYSGESIKVQPVPVAELYFKRNKRNIRFREYAVTHTDRLRISPIQGCSFNCKFCDLNSTKRYQFYEIDDILESVYEAKNDLVVPAKHVMISGGTPFESHFSRIDQIYNEVAEKADIPVDVMLSPIREIDYIEKLYSWGVNALSINMEMWNDELAKKIMPQKYAIGKDYYLKFIKKGIDIFGEGKVQSLLLVGLEPMEDTLIGIKELSEIGCVPVLSPYRPPSYSKYIGLLPQKPPNFDELRKCYLESLKIVKDNNMKLGPKCIPCHHNTLTFPDGSNFYKHY